MTNSPETDHPSPVNRNWLLELLKKHPNPTTPADLREKALVVAPMVDQSDLPFRLQCRRYGANLAFTPMIHTKMFQTNEFYNRRFFNLVEGLPREDRPVIAQLCGSNIAWVTKTAREIQHFVDGIDLNCGCPQNIAKKGEYGAFLLEDEEKLLAVVKALVSEIDIPVSVKVRLLPSGVEDSMKLYQKLVNCGISMLTIHGRTRFSKGPLIRECDWQAIRLAVEKFGDKIPIIANGSIASLHDVRHCLEVTKADGVMASEAILEYSAIFMDETLHKFIRSGPGRLHLAKEYMQLARQYPPNKGGQGSGLKCIRMHVHRYLHQDLQDYHDFRDRICEAATMEDIDGCLEELTEIHVHDGHVKEKEYLSWYMRHRTKDGGNGWIEERKRDGKSSIVQNPEEAAECNAGLFGQDCDDDGDY